MIRYRGRRTALGAHPNLLRTCPLPRASHHTNNIQPSYTLSRECKACAWLCMLGEAASLAMEIEQLPDLRQTSTRAPARHPPAWSLPQMSRPHAVSSAGASGGSCAGSRATPGPSCPSTRDRHHWLQQPVSLCSSTLPTARGARAACWAGGPSVLAALRCCSCVSLCCSTQFISLPQVKRSGLRRSGASSPGHAHPFRLHTSYLPKSYMSQTTHRRRKRYAPLIKADEHEQEHAGGRTTASTTCMQRCSSRNAVPRLTKQQHRSCGSCGELATFRQP